MADRKSTSESPHKRTPTVLPNFKNKRQLKTCGNQWTIENTFLYALSSNNAWAGYKAHQNPNFFPKLASGQAPQIRESCL